MLGEGILELNLKDIKEVEDKIEDIKKLSFNDHDTPDRKKIDKGKNKTKKKRKKERKRIKTVLWNIPASNYCKSCIKVVYEKHKDNLI